MARLRKALLRFRFSALALLSSCVVGAVGCSGTFLGVGGGAGADSGPALVEASAVGDSSLPAQVDAGDGGKAASDSAVDAGFLFFDDFGRPDGPSLGNGWFCKQASRWELVGGSARKRPVIEPGTAYRDNLCVRPLATSVVDVEVSAELVFEKAPIGFVQINARVQPTSSAANRMDGYLLLLDQAGNLVHISRQLGTGFQTNLATFAISPSVNTTDVFRMTLRVSGATTVSIDGKFERRVANEWVRLGALSFVDSSAERILAPGTFGFSVDETDGQKVDNFKATLE